MLIVAAIISIIFGMTLVVRLIGQQGRGIGLHSKEVWDAFLCHITEPAHRGGGQIHRLDRRDRHLDLRRPCYQRMRLLHTSLPLGGGK